MLEEPPQGIKVASVFIILHDGIGEIRLVKGSVLREESLSEYIINLYVYLFDSFQQKGRVVITLLSRNRGGQCHQQRQVDREVIVFKKAIGEASLVSVQLMQPSKQRRSPDKWDTISASLVW